MSSASHDMYSTYQSKKLKGRKRAVKRSEFWVYNVLEDERARGVWMRAVMLWSCLTLCHVTYSHALRASITDFWNPQYVQYVQFLWCCYLFMLLVCTLLAARVLSCINVFWLWEGKPERHGRWYWLEAFSLVIGRIINSNRFVYFHIIHLFYRLIVYLTISTYSDCSTSSIRHAVYCDNVMSIRKSRLNKLLAE